jgi:thiamine-monophosphate kinase
MRKSREEQIINILSSILRLQKQPFPLDDVALVDLGRSGLPRLLAFKCDMLVGSTDVPPRMSPWQISRKSIVSCISDFAAKGIEPSSCMLSLGLPKSISLHTVRSLAHGFRIAAKEFGINILGGDTNSSNELTIDCSMIGHCNCPISKIPAQSGARPGDIIVTSGVFGQAAAGLRIVLNNARSNRQMKASFIFNVMMPKPRLKFGTAFRKYFSSSIDSSDGLAFSLYRLAIKSKVNLFIDRIPMAAGIREFSLENGLDYDELVWYGGEEYEIVGTIPSHEIRKARRLASAKNLELIEIGIVSKGNGKVMLAGKNDSQEGLENRGYSGL